MPSILVLGATGLVGRECVRLLLADPHFDRVVVVARRTPGPEVHAPKLESYVVDFERLADWRSVFAVDAVICALGTTMKHAGTEERFHRVDHDYPLEAARLALQAGAHHFLLVSAVGADPRSRVFYNRVKGELERDILSLPFQSVTIVRPSLLLGARHELRPLELLGKWLRFLPLRRYKPVSASTVAAKLVQGAKRHQAGRVLIENEQLAAIS